MNAWKLSRCAVIAALVIGFVSAPLGADLQYRVTDLGTLGAFPSRAWGIDSQGRVVGESSVRLADEHLHGFLWNGAIVDLGAQPGWPHSIAFGLNDAGQAVGPSFRLGEMNDAATRWQSGVIEPIGDFTPRGLNADCVVVGVRSVDRGDGQWIEEAVRWDNGALTALPTLGGRNAWAAAINDAGWIVGASESSDELAVHATLWIADIASDLGTLGGSSSQALAINGAGQVVGWSDTADGGQHAFLVELDGGGNVVARHDLGELAGGTSYAYGLNSRGDVVGTSDDTAFLWTQGAMIDLNTRIDPLSGWTLNEAVAINDAGQVAGHGVIGNEPHAFLLTPGSDADCASIQRLSAKCVDGKLVAKIASTLPEGTVLTLTHNDADPKTLVINTRGKGRVKWRTQSGSQLVEIVECPEQTATADCG